MLLLLAAYLGCGATDIKDYYYAQQPEPIEGWMQEPQWCVIWSDEMLAVKKGHAAVKLSELLGFIYVNPKQ